jgi:hypothetical protein
MIEAAMLEAAALKAATARLTAAKTAIVECHATMEGAAGEATAEAATAKAATMEAATTHTHAAAAETASATTEAAAMATTHPASATAVATSASAAAPTAATRQRHGWRSEANGRNGQQRDHCLTQHHHSPSEIVLPATTRSADGHRFGETLLALTSPLLNSAREIKFKFRDVVDVASLQAFVLLRM